MLVEDVYAGGGDGTLDHIPLRHAVDVCDGAQAVDGEDVDLVRIAQDVAESERSLVECVGQSIGAVGSHGRADEAVGAFIWAETSQENLAAVIFAKQHLDTKCRMAHRCRIAEGVIASDLLKPADVMKQAEQPCKVHVALVHPKRPSDALAQVGNSQSVLDLQRDARVGGVVGAHIRVKRAPCLPSVHMLSPLFCVYALVKCNARRPAGQR